MNETEDLKTRLMLAEMIIRHVAECTKICQGCQGIAKTYLECMVTDDPPKEVQEVDKRTKI